MQADRNRKVVPDVLGIAGSLRRDSFNRRLLQAAVEIAAPEMHVQLYDHLASVPLFSEDIEAAALPAGVQHLREQVARADAVLIATPEYNQSVPGVLKNAIDWLSRPPDECLANKPVAVIGATAGRWGTRLAQSHLRHVLYATEALVMPRPSLFIAGAADLFDVDGHLVDERTSQALHQLLLAFGAWIARNGSTPQAITV
jgi:chromate reductase, NAD(P)H dehydrogenase (quinone)